MADYSSGGSKRIKSSSLEMEIIDLSKDWIRVRIRSRDYEPNKRLCIEIRKMLNHHEENPVHKEEG